jgi:TolB protein
VRFLCLAIVLVLAPAAVGEPPRVTRLTTDGHLKQRPAWSPDGNTLAFTRHQGATIFLFLRSADGKERRLTKGDSPEYDACWSPDGKRLTFAFDKTVPNQGDIEVHAIGADGENQHPVATSPGKLTHEEWPAWSPDGERIAFTSTREDNQEIHVCRPDGKDLKRLTSDPGIDAHPCWSPDSKRIVFATSRWGGLELAIMNADDGSGLARLTESRGLDDYPAWSPDGQRLAFTTNRDGNLEIYTVDAEGKNPRNETQNAAIESFPAWSPDGRLTFVSNREGGFDVYRLEPTP